MAVEDRIDLVGPRRRLVDALAVDGNDTLCASEEVVERGKIAGGKLSRGGRRVNVEPARLRERGVEADRVGADVVAVDAIRAREMGEQSGE